MKICTTEFGKLHEDTLRAIRLLEAEVKRKVPSMRLRFRGPAEVTWDFTRAQMGPTGCPPEQSMLPAGREVELELEGEGSAEHRLAVLWGLAIPLGWVPWLRYPLIVPGSSTFHFLGKWVVLGDLLSGTGRGETVWPSICAAAQIDAETWEGSARVERRIQSLLLLQGNMVGPVDGVMGPTTLGVIKALGWGSLPLRAVLQRLEDMTMPSIHTGKAVPARLTTDAQFSVNTFGSVRARKDVKGAIFEVKGAGRLVVDFHGT